MRGAADCRAAAASELVWEEFPRGGRTSGACIRTREEMNLGTVSQGEYDSLRAGEHSEEAKIQDCRRKGGH